METGAIVGIIVVIIVSPLLIWAVAIWLRLFVAAWVVLIRRVLGTHDRTKDFAEEIGDTAFENTEYNKMKREFEKKWERVGRDMDARRGKPL